MSISSVPNAKTFSDTKVSYNCLTGEYLETPVKPAGPGWNEPHDITREDLEFLDNN